MGLILSALEAIGKVLYGYSSLEPYQKMKPGPLNSKKVPFTSEWELYHNTISSCSMQVRCALAAMDVPYRSHHVELIEIGSFYENLSEWYCNLHPGRVVPLLIHQGTPIYNSTDQIEYLMNELQKQSDGKPMKPRVFRFNSQMSDEERCSVMEIVELADLHFPLLDGSNCTDTLGTCIPLLSLPLGFSMAYQLVNRDFTTVWVFLLECIRGLFIHFDKRRPLLWMMFAIICKLPGNLPLIVFSYLIQNSPLTLGRVKSRQAISQVHFPKIERILKQTQSNNDGKPCWLFGDQCTLADLALIPFFERIEQAGSADLFVDSNRQGTLIADYWTFIKDSNVYKKGISDWTNDVSPVAMLAGRDVLTWIESCPEFRNAVRCT